MALSERAAIPDTLAQIVPLEQQGLYHNLHEGLRHRRDHVTLRTLLIDFKTILGIPEKDAPWQPLAPKQFFPAKALLEQLTAGTYSAPLIPEFLYSLGFDKRRVIAETNPQPLNFLLVSGRYLQDPLFFDLVDELASQSYSIATLNPVGTYNDGQRRVMGLSTLLRPVDHLVILASTQNQQGGSVEVMENVIRILKNPEIAKRVRAVTVAIPMFGGSRGHRLSQSPPVGFEVFEAESSAKDFCHTTRRIINSLKKHHHLKSENIPPFRFVSIDIHNQDQPGSTFVRRRFEFASVDPAQEFATAAYQELGDKQLLHLPVKVVACDEGAIPRTEEMAQELLHHPQNHLRSLDVVFIKKIRTVAGKVDRAWINKVEHWTLNPNGSISKSPLSIPSPEDPSLEECVILLTDDMLDTCNTASDDTNLAHAHYSGTRYTIFAATHPILSKGPENLNKIAADLILVGNTLISDELTQAINSRRIQPQVRVVNLAPTLARILTS